MQTKKKKQNHNKERNGKNKQIYRAHKSLNKI